MTESYTFAISAGSFSTDVSQSSCVAMRNLHGLYRPLFVTHRLHTLSFSSPTYHTFHSFFARTSFDYCYPMHKKSLRTAAKARARRESALLNRTLRTYPSQARSDRMSFRLDTAWGYRGEDMGGVGKACTLSSSERTWVYEVLSDTHH